MARIIYPDSLPKWLVLLQNIIAKDTNDGAASALKPYLVQQGIVLADELNALNSATVFDTNFAQAGRDSEKNKELRDLKFKEPNSVLRSSAQYLKSFYKPNFKELGEWGLPVLVSGRIAYPPDFQLLAKTFIALRDKHASFAPAPSPLTPFLVQHNFDIDSLAADCATALGFHSAMQTLSRQSENDCEQRDLLLRPAVSRVRGMGMYLIKLFAPNAKAVGDWGFTVDHSPRPPKIQTSKLKPAAKKTIKGAVIGSLLTNTGKTELHIYKGKTTSGPFAALPAGETYEIGKGFSVITVLNPSSTQGAAFKTLRLV